jgi:23S rRNA (cytidine1920-2'-O)/16S rRNA (cytidine1409-2'-O)-methyltransferase
MSERRRLDVLLVERGLCDTRARAQARILAGEVIVAGERVDKAGTKVPVDAQLRLKGDGLRWVSRGGLKLEAALEAFGADPAGRVCLDVGASTGGFTDVLLARGAARVYAVDVGYGQLAWRLRQDERVVCMERTHIGRLEPAALEPRPSLGVVDVSFISLTRVLGPMLAQLEERCWVLALIKPQFEVGRQSVGKGGIVRDAEAREEAVQGVVRHARALGLHVEGPIESPIHGADGNVEYLVALRREPAC